jgi:hypothetical protein
VRTDELKKILEDLPPHFFGTVEIGYQNGYPGVVKTTKTQRLADSDTIRKDRGYGNKST